jgi:hypothetical protein
MTVLRMLVTKANREKALIRHFTLTFAALTTKLFILKLDILFKLDK